MEEDEMGGHVVRMGEMSTKCLSGNLKVKYE
jgi:hypothetical protein